MATSKPIIGYNASGKPIYGGPGTLYPNATAAAPMGQTNTNQPTAQVAAMTNAQRAALGQGYSTIEGDFNSATGQRNTPAPSAPQTPTYQSVSAPKYDTSANPYEKQLAALQGLSSEEQQLKNQETQLDEQLRNFNNSANQMNQNIGNQPIARGFISGQQQAVASQAAVDRAGITGQQMTLQEKLANAQQKRQASIDAIKFSYDQFGQNQAKKNQYLQQKYENEVNQANTANDQAYRNAVLNKKETSADAGFTLNEGDRRFDAQGNLIASGGPKTYAPKSNTPSPTQQKSLLTQTLNTGMAPNGQKIGNGRGPDGFVDPGVYLEAFKQWTGTPAQFLSAFPVKTNVNPLSYGLLPAALKGSVTSSRGA